ncbi:MAG: Holliday junction branch migration protein RuvA [Catalinimonas sp.]
MIAYIEGKLAVCEPTYAVLDVQGVGYQLFISLNTYIALKDQQGRCKLLTHLHVKEDAQLLYGFREANERNLFLHLISVSGIGPTLALVMLSSLSAEEIYQAILNGDHHTLQSVKGIGAKTAQRAVLELKDKVRKENPNAEFGTATAVDNTVRDEALTALVTLGIPKPAAEKSIAQVLKAKGGALTVEEIIKHVLKSA